LLWANGHFIRELPLDKLYHQVSRPEPVDLSAEAVAKEGGSGQISRQAQDDNPGYWPIEARDFSNAYKKQVLGLVQERLKFFAELPELTHFFFTEPTVDVSLLETNKQLKKLEKNRLHELLTAGRQALEASDFTAEDLQAQL